jgi:hypothetical protein
MRRVSAKAEHALLSGREGERKSATLFCRLVQAKKIARHVCDPHLCLLEVQAARPQSERVQNTVDLA